MLLEFTKQQMAIKKLIERNYEQRREHRIMDVKKVEIPFVVVKLCKKFRNCKNSTEKESDWHVQ